MRGQVMNKDIIDYNEQIKKGHIQKAYRTIMGFMSALKTHISKKFPNYLLTSLYPGYMDMTYFAIMSESLKKKQLKIAIVYLHEQNAFEVWLSAVNKNVQKKYVNQLKDAPLKYKLSSAKPGVDSILELQIIDNPDFDQAEKTYVIIENAVTRFMNEILSYL
jgi:hypothetical protein